MSDWKVSKERIALFPHPNADKLALGKVGQEQVVVQQGQYTDGEVVLFAPERSVLSGALLDVFRTYLVGPDKNRVKAISLRGEPSCGIILSDDLVFAQCGKHIADLPFGEDVSKLLGITRYVAPIPTELAGDVVPIAEGHRFGKHDCEQFGVYASELAAGETVVITEKLHGSQVVLYIDLASGYRFITSKGFLDKGLCLVESPRNAYWRGSGAVWELLATSLKTGVFQPADQVQVFGELVPCQGRNWSYGYSDPVIRVFDVRVNGTSIPYDKLGDAWRNVWVPVVFHGAYDTAQARALREGKEAVSGREEHIREGVVVRPYIDRRATDGTRLVLKLINPSYKETGEEFT